jgi:hypothetical protein
VNSTTNAATNQDSQREGLIELHTSLLKLNVFIFAV